MTLRYIISSHVRYYDQTVPRLLQSLLPQIRPADIIVVASGAEAAKQRKLKGVMHWYTTYEAFEYSALIALAENQRTEDRDWFFLLHDTCEAGENFSHLTQHSDNLPPNAFSPDFDHFSLDPNGFTNMGAYRVGFLREIRPYLQSLKGCSKMRALMAECVFRRMGRGGAYSGEPYQTLREEDVYKNGVRRQVLHFPTVNLTKYQATHAKASEMYRTP